MGGKGGHHIMGFPERERSQQDSVFKVGLEIYEHFDQFVFRGDNFILRRRARGSDYADKSFYWQFKQVFFVF